MNHIDLENELYDNGSENGDIFGGNIMKDPIEVVWEAHPNIERNRTLGIGRGREITDQKTQEEPICIFHRKSTFCLTP